jgi:hypothetical protein
MRPILSTFFNKLIFQQSRSFQTNEQLHNLRCLRIIKSICAQNNNNLLVNPIIYQVPDGLAGKWVWNQLILISFYGYSNAKMNGYQATTEMISPH